MVSCYLSSLECCCKPTGVSQMKRLAQNCRRWHQARERRNRRRGVQLAGLGGAHGLDGSRWMGCIKTNEIKFNKLLNRQD